MNLKKHSLNNITEQENTYTITCRGDVELSELSRFKFWTDGIQGLAFLGIEKCGKADEGSYTCLLTNRFGKREHKFKLFVSSKSREQTIQNAQCRM